MTDLTMHAYESPSLKDLVDEQDFGKCDNIQQLYIDNQLLNIEEMPEEDFSVLQQEISPSSALKEHNNNKITQDESLRDRATSNIYNIGRIDPHMDHGYANMSSPSSGTITPQYSPVGFSNSFTNGSANKLMRFGPLSELNLGVKLFVGDTLNTPDILESVVSLEDDRFNFLRNLDEDQVRIVFSQ